MERQERRTINRLFDIGEKAQFLSEIPGTRNIVNLVAGSNSEAYKQARWQKAVKVTDAGGNERDLPVAAGDPDAPALGEVIQRLKKAAVVLASGRVALDEFFNTNHGSMPAVAIQVDGQPRIGLLKEDLKSSFGNFPEFRYTAALRKGRSDFGVGMGIWLPSERSLIVADDLEIAHQNIAIDELPSDWPGTPLY